MNRAARGHVVVMVVISLAWVAGELTIILSEPRWWDRLAIIALPAIGIWGLSRTAAHLCARLDEIYPTGEDPTR